MDNVIPIGGVTLLDIPADEVLEGCKGKLAGVVIIGVDEEGEQYFASSISNGAEVLWYLEQLKSMLLGMP